MIQLEILCIQLKAKLWVFHNVLKIVFHHTLHVETCFTSLIQIIQICARLPRTIFPFGNLCYDYYFRFIEIENGSYGCYGPPLIIYQNFCPDLKNTTKELVFDFQNVNI